MITEAEKLWMLEGLKINSSTLATAVPQQKLRELFDAKYRLEKAAQMHIRLLAIFNALVDGHDPEITLDTRQCLELFHKGLAELKSL